MSEPREPNPLLAAVHADIVRRQEEAERLRLANRFMDRAEGLLLAYGPVKFGPLFGGTNRYLEPGTHSTPEVSLPPTEWGTIYGSIQGTYERKLITRGPDGSKIDQGEMMGATLRLRRFSNLTKTEAVYDLTVDDARLLGDPLPTLLELRMGMVTVDEIERRFKVLGIKPHVDGPNRLANASISLG